MRGPGVHISIINCVIYVWNTVISCYIYSYINLSADQTNLSTTSFKIHSNKIVSTNLFYINSVLIAQLLCIVSVNPTLAVYKAAESVPFTNLTWSTDADLEKSIICNLYWLLPLWLMLSYFGWLFMCSVKRAWLTHLFIRWPLMWCQQKSGHFQKYKQCYFSIFSFQKPTVNSSKSGTRNDSSGSWGSWIQHRFCCLN